MNSYTPVPGRLVDALLTAQHLVVLTGSGVSAESGIPTFREAQTGLWSRYDPHQLATPQAFAANPRIVWEWYEWRRDLIRDAQPNEGHLALASLERNVHRFTLITQNVDGLHQLAGSHNVLELHGNIRRTICSSERTIINEWLEDNEALPRCPNCQAYLRPDVVWFGESLPSDVIGEAITASSACDMFLSVGTSAIVQPAASLAHIALEQGALVVEINAEQTPLSPHADFSLFGKAGELLPVLSRILEEDNLSATD